MPKQRRRCNLPPAPATWTQDVLKGTGLLKERIRIPVERISLPTPLLLTHLVGNNHFPLGRLPPPTQRRTKTTNEVPGAAEDRDKVVTPTTPPRVSISFPQRKKGTCPKLSAIIAIGKNITPTSVLGI